MAGRKKGPGYGPRPDGRGRHATADRRHETRSTVAKPLVIVESPAKAKTIAGYLGSDYKVMASVGHIRDLPGQQGGGARRRRRRHGRLAGIDPDDHFDVVYVVHKNKKNVVTELKQALKRADELILATDEDREGEAIGWHVLEVLQPKVPVKRMVFHEITPHAIREALDSPRELDMKLVEAQEGRRILDRLVGWETSPVLWRVFGRGQAASAGSGPERRGAAGRRARTRAHAIPSGQLARPRGRLPAAAETRPFRATLVELDGQPSSPRPRLRSRDRHDRRHGRRRRAARRRRGASGSPRTVAGTSPSRSRSVDSKPFTERPRAPFTTSTLQQESGRKLRFTASRTMAIAQRLYERGYITYMRTDSTNLSEQAITAAAEPPFASSTATSTCPTSHAAYRSKVKNAQEAHEAIRPAGERDPQARRSAQRARRGRAASLRVDLDAHDRVPDGPTHADAR